LLEFFLLAALFKNITVMLAFHLDYLQNK